MTGHQYIFPSRVENAETAGWRPSRDELREEQHAVDRRRQRAAQARTRVTGDQP